MGDEHIARNISNSAIKQITEEGKRIANVSEALRITEQTIYR